MASADLGFSQPIHQRLIDAGANEEELITEYFQEGCEYNVILDYLSTYHDIYISLSTLKRRLRLYGLSRRQYPIDLATAMIIIRNELRITGQLFGYRQMYKTLRDKYNINIRRDDVMAILRRLNPVGLAARRRRRLVRRVYRANGPNYVWHVDGYDKLKPYGFAISGCIDGFSRRILWLVCGPSNNNPAIIATNYVKCLVYTGKCPMRLRTDAGTENGTIAAMQCALRNNHHDRYRGKNLSLGKTHFL